MTVWNPTWYASIDTGPFHILRKRIDKFTAHWYQTNCGRGFGGSGSMQRVDWKLAVPEGARRCTRCFPE